MVNTMTTDEHALGQTWSQRQEAETENWEGARGALYDNALSAFAVPISRKFQAWLYFVGYNGILISKVLPL